MELIMSTKMLEEYRGSQLEQAGDYIADMGFVGAYLFSPEKIS